MIIIILSIVLLIVGIILMKIGLLPKSSDWKICLGLSFIIVSLIALLTSIAIILTVQINKDIDYQNKLYEREVLEYRIENTDKNTIGNEMLYNDIVEFNNSLRITKKWSNNPWTNWFNNEDIATIDYIEIEK